jgi:hypothetical protein
VSLLVAASLAAAQAPVHHGLLRIAKASRGRIDLNSGYAKFAIPGWEFLISADSDGIDPAAERVLIAVAEEQFLLPPGSLRASRNGKRYTYRGTSGIRSLKIVRTSGSSLRIRAKLADVNLARVVLTDEAQCLPFAVVIGNDDGFDGVFFDRPKPFPSTRLAVLSRCDAAGEWPWL